MSLHRLLGFRAAVADPAALAAYYGEMGLVGDAASGYTGSGGGAAVVLDEAPVRRLVSVDLGCADEGDLEDVRRRLEAGGASPTSGGDSVSAVDPASRRRVHGPGGRTRNKGCPDRVGHTQRAGSHSPCEHTRISGVRWPTSAAAPRPPGDRYP